MRKKKKIKTIIVEKFKYDNEDYGIRLAPELLLKLLEFAHTEATSDVQLHSIVTRAHIMAHQKEDCLYMEDYVELVTDTVPMVEIPVESTPAEETTTVESTQP